MKRIQDQDTKDIQDIEKILIENGNMQNENNINLSDVIEAIKNTDPEFSAQTKEPPEPQSTIIDTSNNNNSTNENITMIRNREHSINNTGLGPSGSSTQPPRNSAYVKILEQPASKAMRFRYECEGRSAGSIPGASSTPENKTFPTIKICGYYGKAVVVVSCVTKDEPYRPHPHNLVGKDGCRKGVCTVEVPPETMTVTFSNLGIRCVKKKDIENALNTRENIRVDPFRTGFAHRTQPSSIDLNAVRLCFQAFLEGQSGKFTVPLTPVVSEPIYDKKAMSDLAIFSLSDDNCTVAGGRKIILLCEKVTKEDIQVRFFEEKDGNCVWEGFGEFTPSEVHRQVAIAFRTPKYQTLDIKEPVRVFIQLVRPSDKTTSEPVPFEYTPLETDSDRGKRKRQRYGMEYADDKYDDNNYIRVYQLDNANKNIQGVNFPENVKLEPRGSLTQGMNYLNPVKTEPKDSYLKTYGGGLSPSYSPGHEQQYLNTSPNSSPSPVLDYDPQSGSSYYRNYNISPSHQLNIPQTINGQSPKRNAEQYIVQDNKYDTPMIWLNTENGQNLNVANSIHLLNNLGNTSRTENSLLNNDVQQTENNGQNDVSMNIESSQLSNLLDLDNGELKQLNSAELAAGFNSNVFENLSANLSSSLLISEGIAEQSENNNNMNMSDSFTRLTRSTIDGLSNLNKLNSTRIKK